MTLRYSTTNGELEDRSFRGGRGAAPRAAEAHAPYVFGADRSTEAVRRLAEVEPTVVTSERPLLRTTARGPDARLEIVPFQDPDTGRYMNVLAGIRIELAPELVAALARKAEANRRNFPRESTLAGAFGLPGLYMRVDCFITVTGAARSLPGAAPDRDAQAAVWSPEQWKCAEIAICEFDDQPAFVGSFRRAGHRTAFEPFRRLADELAALGRPLRLAEDDADPAFYTLDNYPHDDRQWLSDMGRRASAQTSAAVVRARRWVPGSRRFLERWEPASIFPGSSFRDYKGVLGLPREADQELGLGVLVRDHEVARRVIELAHRRGLGAVMAKGLYSARKEAAMAVSPGSKVHASYYRLNQLSRLSQGWDDGAPYLQPLVLQPAFAPPTFANLGIRFTDGDAAAVRAHRYRLRCGRAGTGDDVFTRLPAPGSEPWFHGLFRLYFVYLPSENRGAAKRARFAGGLLQGCTTPMAIHGSNGALTVWVHAREPQTWPRIDDGGDIAEDGPPWVDVGRLARFAAEPSGIAA